MATTNPVNEAVKDIISIDNFLQQACSKDSEEEKPGQSKAEQYGTKFRSRIREFPTLLLSSGLIPATTLLLSKAELTKENNKKLFNSLLSILEDSKENNSDDNICKVKDENAGIIILLALIVKHLKTTSRKNIDTQNPARSIASLLLDLSKQREQYKQAEGYILSYTLEAKKLAEAFYKSE